MYVVQTSNRGSYARGSLSGQQCLRMRDIYATSNMLSMTSWNGCTLRMSSIVSGGSWNTIGLGGCSDNANENTAFQLNSGNGGGYLHNRQSCGTLRNYWGSFGSCNSN